MCHGPYGCTVALQRCTVAPVWRSRPWSLLLYLLPTVRPTVRSILKACKCAITLFGRLLVITGKTAWNWRRAVLSCCQRMLAFLLIFAVLLVRYPLSSLKPVLNCEVFLAIILAVLLTYISKFRYCSQGFSHIFTMHAPNGYLLTFSENSDTSIWFFDPILLIGNDISAIWRRVLLILIG